MNATNLAQAAYATTRSPIRTARSTEYEAFARITSRLKQAAEKGRAGFAILAEAIHDNRRLWSTLALDVADDGNGLPQDLRARILYLADFTNQHSAQVLRGRAKADILVEINTAIMRGLRAQAGTP